MGDSKRIWFALFVLAVFCVGAAGGILIGMRLDRPDRPWRPGMAGVERGGAPRGGPILLERLTRELDLDASQREQIRGILDASRTRVTTLQRDVRQRFDDEQRTLHEEITKVLTPEQQKRFERILERRSRGRGRRP